MGIFDIAIIYLACGAPAAAARWIALDGTATPKRLGLSLIDFLVWPVRFVQYIHGSITKVEKRHGSAVSIPEEFESVRRQLESCLPPKMPAGEILEFRNIFWRYVGTRLAVDDVTTMPASASFFELGGSPADAAAIACFVRRESARLESHRRDAVRSLLELAAGLDPRAREILINTAGSLGDERTIAELEAVQSGTPVPEFAPAA